MSSTFGQAPGPITQSSSTQPQLDAAAKFALLQHMQQIRSGANWFYWIAGLSLINTLAALSGTNWRFLLGLGVTQIADVVALRVGGAGRIAGLTIDAIAIAFFVLIGKFAGKPAAWAFIIGMAVFAIDGVISFVIRDWIGGAFHLYALYCIYRGYKHVNELSALTAA